MWLAPNRDFGLILRKRIDTDFRKVCAMDWVKMVFAVPKDIGTPPLCHF